MSLEQLMAFTVNPDYARQERCYADIGITPVMSSDYAEQGRHAIATPM